MKIFKTKSIILSGTNYKEISKKAFSLYNGIRRKTKRRPYVRSAYFKKEKIFLDLFWNHLFKKKNWRDRLRRMKYFGCAIELLEKSHCEPVFKYNQGNPGETLFRFYGCAKSNELFCVQIKENRKGKQKCLISVFPVDRV